MKKIVIFSLHLGYGGIEKCICNLANMLSDIYDVEIVSTYKLYDKSPFEINDNVKVTYLIEKYKPNREEWFNALHKLNIFKLIKETYIALLVLMLRRTKTVKAMKNTDADIYISTRTLFNKWLGKSVNKSKFKIAWEHNHHHGNIKYAEEVVKSCKHIDNLVLVSDSLRSFYKKEMKNKNYKCKCSFIPNSLDNIPDKLSKLNNKRLISVGRMSREKGFPDLIDVFKLAYEKDNELTLDIIGDGAQKNMVVDKIYQEKLQKVITFHGYQNKEYIDKLLNKSSVYLMTSYTESFGIVLIEAMSHGVPCISFSSAEGACDIIENDKDGYLIRNRNNEKMAEKIVEVLNNQELLQTLGENARNKSLNYSSELVKKKWINLLKRG